MEQRVARILAVVLRPIALPFLVPLPASFRVDPATVIRCDPGLHGARRARLAEPLHRRPEPERGGASIDGREMAMLQALAAELGVDAEELRRAGLTLAAPLNRKRLTRLVRSQTGYRPSFKGRRSKRS